MLGFAGCPCVNSLGAKCCRAGKGRGKSCPGVKSFGTEDAPWWERVHWEAGARGGMSGGPLLTAVVYSPCSNVLLRWIPYGKEALVCTVRSERGFGVMSEQHQVSSHGCIPISVLSPWSWSSHPSQCCARWGTEPCGSPGGPLVTAGVGTSAGGCCGAADVTEGGVQLLDCSPKALGSDSLSRVWLR